MTFPIVAGRSYHIVVDGRDGEQGFFRLDLSCSVPATACDPHAVVRCGELVGNDSAAGRALVDSWPACAPWDESGPEYVYQFAPTENARVRAVLDTTQTVEDLDIFVVQDQGAGCSPAGCIAHGDLDASWDAVAGGVYYVIVDGRAGASDIFRLWLSCERAPGACRPTSRIACGETHASRNDAPGSTNAVDLWACRPYPEQGPEMTFEFVPTADANVTVTLSNMTADLDIFVLRDDGLGCNDASCIGGANATLTFPATAGTTYFLVVDGYLGARGAFDISVLCN